MTLSASMVRSRLASKIPEAGRSDSGFTAYQSALLSSPILLLRVVFSLLQFPAWMRTGLTLVILIVLGYFA
jgi:hypothetical protein